MDDRKIISELIALAAEMVRSEGMPSPFLEDWHLPAKTSKYLCREISRKSSQAIEKSISWGVRLRGIVDEMRLIEQKTMP